MKIILKLFGFGIVLLSFYALYNKFPLVGNFRELSYQFTWPNFYLPFIRLTSFSFSIWLVVLAQATLMSYVLYQYFIAFKIPENSTIYLFFPLTFCSSVSLLVSTIDFAVFHSLAILCTGYFLLENTSRLTKRVFAVIIFLTLLIDPINLVFIATCFTFKYLRKLKYIHYIILLLIFVEIIFFLIFLGALPTYLLFSNYLFPADAYQITTDSREFLYLFTNFNWESRQFLLSRQYQNWLNLNFFQYSIFVSALIAFLHLLKEILFFNTKHTGYIDLSLYFLYSILIVVPVMLVLKFDKCYQVSWTLMVPFLLCVYHKYSSKWIQNLKID